MVAHEPTKNGMQITQTGKGDNFFIGSQDGMDKDNGRI
jgi:hypothetical protein